VLASALEITFMLLVGGVTILAGLFGLYVLVQLFRNPSRR
jgi:ABC-type phosphate transport system permease subunit